MNEHKEENMTDTPSPPPMQLEITADLTHVRCILAVMIEHLTAPDAPKSRERSIVVTHLETAYLFAGQGLMKE